MYEEYLYENILTDDLKKSIKKKFFELSKSTEKKTKEIDTKLEKYGIDVEEIRKKAFSVAEQTKIKNGKFTNFGTKLNIFLNDIFKNKLKTTTGKVLFSIAMLIVVKFIQFFLAYLLNSVVGPRISLLITMVLIAPLVEETAKVISIQKGTTWPYFVIFNIAEFTDYIIYRLSLGVSLPIAIAIQLIVVIMHWILTIIHIEAKRENQVKEGWSLAVLIHAFLNTLGTLPLVLKG